MNAILAILMSLAGNAIWHLIAAGLLAMSWIVVVAVGGIPALVLGLVSHLAVLRSQVEPEDRVRDEARTKDVPVVLGPSRRPYRTPGPTSSMRADDELLALARKVDAEHRAAHGGRPITRDALRQLLRVGGTRATAIAQALRAERDGL